MTLVFLASALLIGGLLAVQASANLQLTQAAGTPYGAALLQLGLAAVLLAVAATVTGSIGAIADLADVPAWKLVGGIASPIYITSAILLFPRLGALTSVGLFVTGQMLASVVLDLGGLLGVPRSPVSAGLVVGALAVVAGITIVIRTQRHAPAARTVAAPANTRARPGWVVLGLTAGAVLPVQGAINASLRAEIPPPLAVGTISFAVATATIAAVFGVLRTAGHTSAPRLRPLATMPRWGWLGGAAAATYVTATFLLIPAIGAATTVALTVTGQQIASAAIDHYGLFRLPPRALTKARIGGLTALIIGCALVQLT
jgi:bacterial/archaeal transporter family-2 protein